MVLAADSESDRGRRALEELCSQYWPPLYAYARHRGSSEDDAKELTQAFFVDLLERSTIDRADPDRGRFRSFLLRAFQNFIAGEWRKARTLKRGGDVRVVSIDVSTDEGVYSEEPSDHLTPELLFEHKWALQLLSQAHERLHNRYLENGQESLFMALKSCLSGGAVSYADLEANTGMTQGALRTAVSRLRSRWSRELRNLVAETVEREDEVEDELRHLLEVLGSV